MKITKIGHCCLLIETQGRRILTDPGAFTAEDLVIENIDIVLITHEHADHLHVASVERIVKANPEVIVVANASVGKILTEAGLAFDLLEGRVSAEYKSILIQAFDEKHAEIYQELGQVQNTGYFIANTLFYPGDSYAEPGREVAVLAFPIGGPWCKVGDAIRYVLKVRPGKAFPVHDGIERTDRVHIVHGSAAAVLSKEGIDFRPMKAGDTEEF
jgi:L-ascorbate metabolism protein UlaG (beta-lactamase superfamily)